MPSEIDWVEAVVRGTFFLKPLVLTVVSSVTLREILRKLLKAVVT
jgi:hypothetical protein